MKQGSLEREHAPGADGSLVRNPRGVQGNVGKRVCLGDKPCWR